MASATNAHLSEPQQAVVQTLRRQESRRLKKVAKRWYLVDGDEIVFDVKGTTVQALRRRGFVEVERAAVLRLSEKGKTV